MNIIKGFLSSGTTRFGEVEDLFVFLWKNKLWWLMPIIFIAVIMSIILIFAQSTGIAPFIYPLF